MSSLEATAASARIPVDTRKCVRRPVRYESPSDVLADAERLAAAGATTTGNWSLAEIVDHVATGVDLMIDGFGYVAPWYVRLVGRALFKRRILRRGMPPRLPFPGGGQTRPFRASVDVADALAHLREATERMKATQQFAPHPVFGQLPREEVLLLHLRHAELHMGFVRELRDRSPGAYASG